MLDRYTRLAALLLMMGLLFLVRQPAKADAGTVACKAGCAAGAVACAEYCDYSNLGVACKAGCAALGVTCSESCDLPEPDVPQQ